MVGVEPPAPPAPVTAVAGPGAAAAKLAERGVKPRKVSAKRSWPPGCGRFPAPPPAPVVSGGDREMGAEEGRAEDVDAPAAVSSAACNIPLAPQQPEPERVVDVDAPAAVSSAACNSAIPHVPQQPEPERVVDVDGPAAISSAACNSAIPHALQQPEPKRVMEERREGGGAQVPSDGGAQPPDGQGEGMVFDVMPLAFAVPHSYDVAAANGSMENGGDGVGSPRMEGRGCDGNNELVREEEVTGHGHDIKMENRGTGGELKEDGRDGDRKKRWLMSVLNSPPKKRVVSAMRRFPPGCGSATVTYASSRDEEGLLLKNTPISVASGNASVVDDLGTNPASRGCATVFCLNNSNVEVENEEASKAQNGMQESQVAGDVVPNNFADAKHVAKASPSSLGLDERMNMKRAPHEGKHVARSMEDDKVRSKHKASLQGEGALETPMRSHIMKNKGNRLEGDSKIKKASLDDTEAFGEGKMRSETTSSKRGIVCSTSDMKRNKVAHKLKPIRIIKDTFHRSNEGSTYGKHAMTNQTKESGDLDLDIDKIIVQALMAPDVCPWANGRKCIASVSQSLTPKSKSKNKNVTRQKESPFKLGFSKMARHKAAKDHEDPYMENDGNSKALVMQSLTPKSKVKNTKATTRKELPLEVSSPKLIRHETTEDHEDTCSDDDGNSKALVMHEGKNKLQKRKNDFFVTIPPYAPCGNQGLDARSRVRKLLILFHATCRKLTQAEENHIRTYNRIDMAAVNHIKQSPIYTKIGPILGNVPGVEIGDEFQYRVELSIVGLHRPYQAGIDTTKEDGVPVAISIVASGGYSDQLPSSDELIYTGSGGQAIGKKEAEDQKLVRGNLALKNCIKAKTPVRVIHGFKGQSKGEVSNSKSKQTSTFTYDGLYTVMECWQEGPDGSKVFKYKLKREPGQPKVALQVAMATRKVKIREGLCLPDISQGSERIPICVINTIDDMQPAPFKYITEVIYPDSYTKESPEGCGCTNGCSDSDTCACAVKNGGEIPFNFSGAIVNAKPLLYECGPLCRCPPTCHNRVSQNGIQIPLEIFKTGKTGWGVRSLSSISSGSFVCEYAGELLEDKEAEERKNNDEYLFDIGHNYDDEELWKGLPTIPGLASATSEKMDDDAGFTIDAAKCGNVGRFINHSCSPNLYAQNVLWDHDEKRMPHIMFFAVENIKPLQELTYHYNYAVGQVHDKNNGEKVKHCLCGSSDCCGRLY